MKNQYFGDNRDLFKYDLILQVIQKIDSINHFTFIPMLTEDDDKGHGEEDNRNKAKAGTNDRELVRFLDKCRSEDRRNVKELERFFKRKAIEMKIYFGKDKFFQDQREEYFEQIGDELLAKSLVFVDPDIGLEIQRSGKEHILYAEVKRLYDRMDKSSILMIYQHFPRIRTQNNIQKYFCERSEELKKIAGDLPIYVDDNEIRFFFLTKDKSQRESLAEVISGYKKSYYKLHIPKFLH